MLRPGIARGAAMTLYGIGDEGVAAVRCRVPEHAGGVEGGVPALSGRMVHYDFRDWADYAVLNLPLPMLLARGR